MHLAQREIVELERQGRRDIRVGRLLVRQDDVEPDRFGADILRAAVRRLHDRWPAARADDEVALALFVQRIARRDAGEFARDLVILALFHQPLGDAAALVVRGDLQQHLRLLGLGDACGAIHDEGGGDVRFRQQQLRFQQLELKADGAQILAQQEVHVLKSEAIGIVLRLRGGDGLAGGSGLLAGAGEDAGGYVGFGHPRLVGPVRYACKSAARVPRAQVTGIDARGRLPGEGGWRARRCSRATAPCRSGGRRRRGSPSGTAAPPDRASSSRAGS